jgi:hypothetical protein
MKPLNLSAMSWNDFVANAVFFVIDVALLSILVPFLVQRYERKKWAPARAVVAERSIRYLDSLDLHFEQLMNGIEFVAGDLPHLIAKESEKIGPIAAREWGRSVLTQRLSESTKNLTQDLESDRAEYLQAIELLVPSFDANISIKTMNFYEASIRPRSMALELLNMWIFTSNIYNTDVGGANPDDIHGSKKLDEIYQGCVRSNRSVQRIRDQVDKHSRTRYDKTP